MPCYSPLKGWKDEISNKIVFRAEGASQTMEVACGQCLGCRLDRSRMWAARIIHEATLHESMGGNCFVTLTYRESHECNLDQLHAKQHVPEDWSLHKSHFQKFMKRLRKAHPNQKIRYFMAGEYGNVCQHRLKLDLVGCPVCNLGRPHYHACLFNYCPSDLEVYTSRNGEPAYTSPNLESIWSYGFVDVGVLNFESAAYVARYILKKVTGTKSEEHYEQLTLDGEIVNLEPEYCSMSLKPGIGYDWYQKYKNDLFPSDETPIPGKGVIPGVPKYYEKLFKESDPLTLAEIKELRQEFKERHADEYSPKRLMAKYNVKRAQIESLKRNL